VVDENVIEGFLMAGTPQEFIDEMIASMQPADVDDDYEIWPENWDVMQIFLSMNADWSIAVGMSGIAYNGIKTTAIESAFNIFRITNKNRLEYFEKIKIMERAALPLLNAAKD
jgi:hypothetical protein